MNKQIFEVTNEKQQLIESIVQEKFHSQVKEIEAISGKEEYCSRAKDAVMSFRVNLTHYIIYD